jgi:hypothetical protein
LPKGVVFIKHCLFYGVFLAGKNRSDLVRILAVKPFFKSRLRTFLASRHFASQAWNGAEK